MDNARPQKKRAVENHRAGEIETFPQGRNRVRQTKRQKKKNERRKRPDKEVRRREATGFVRPEEAGASIGQLRSTYLPR